MNKALHALKLVFGAPTVNTYRDDQPEHIYVITDSKGNESQVFADSKELAMTSHCTCHRVSSKGLNIRLVS